MPISKIRIAIIGGGVAGLIVARHVTSRPEFYSVCLFEQTDEIGGTWVYTDETEFDENQLPVHSSMYENLRTNLPKEIMQIPDFPFKDSEGLPSFVHHSVIRQYLVDYAKHFNLHPHMKLQTLVNHVEPEILSTGETIWLVTFTDLRTKLVKTKLFDVVILCNGHYTVGHFPQIQGIENFHGGIIHSHQYRKPENYAGRKVCILGASWSGIDIALEISKYGDKIYLSHNLPQPLDATLPKNIEQVPGVKSICGNTFFFRDGSFAEIDDFIFCTGYEFTYPFLSKKVEIHTRDNHVEPIYKHLIHMKMKNLFFMGLPTIVVPFPMFHIQAQYIMGILEGRVKLPTPEEMKEDFEREKQSLLDSGIPIRHINKLVDRQWDYYDEIAAAVHVPSFPPVIKKIYNYSNKMRELDLMTYKNYQYRIIDSENFTVSCRKGC
ncbi:flavin-containing monooxygenase FMO GS-OX-like 2 [Leptopilina heterotoma]|uniref:flavin-containing monooxygenase FMO GS-OX-like 2 n=1 Tax=Leptopilina heterotoma TaxID=63436 RepID=UPI001CA99DBC|nr:flavin-containing monooxygenase FMO GS-OX-like 2 [Leptopilina heterotoma]